MIKPTTHYLNGHGKLVPLPGPATYPPIEPLHQAQTATDFTLKIPDTIHTQLMYWVNKADEEVSWFGNLAFNQETKTFTVLKISLLTQTVSAAETEIDAGALAKLMFEVKDEPGELRWWGHSHGKMPVFWSAQDMHTIRELGRQGWILASVFNQKRKVRSAFLKETEVMGNPHDLFIDEVKTLITTSVRDELLTEWGAEFEKKVQIDKWTAPTPYVHPQSNVTDPRYDYAKFKDTNSLYLKFSHCDSFWEAIEHIELREEVDYYETFHLSLHANAWAFKAKIKQDNEVHDAYPQ